MKAAVLQKFCSAAVPFLPHLEECFERFSIVSPLLRIHFMGQSMVETQQFKKFRENLYYTDPERLAKIFKSKMDLDHDGVIEPNEIEAAKAYVKNPEAAANFVYANRFGNGDERSGDGFKFRGGGLFHTTFRDNWLATSLFLFKDDRLVQDPKLIEDPRNAVLSAGYYWHSRNINLPASADNVKEVTRLINPALQGLEERAKFVLLGKSLGL